MNMNSGYFFANKAVTGENSSFFIECKHGTVDALC